MSWITFNMQNVWYPRDGRQNVKLINVLIYLLMNTGENYILGSMIQIKLINRWDFLNRLCIFACCNGDKLLWFPTSIFFISLPFQWVFLILFHQAFSFGSTPNYNKQASKQTNKKTKCYNSNEINICRKSNGMGWRVIVKQSAWWEEKASTFLSTVSYHTEFLMTNYQQFKAFIQFLITKVAAIVDFSKCPRVSEFLRFLNLQGAKYRNHSNTLCGVSFWGFSFGFRQIVHCRFTSSIRVCISNMVTN